MKVTILFILLGLIASCGNSGRKPSTESQLGSALTAGGEFASSEKNIALKICYAFRSKNTNYRASYIDSSFNFNTSYSDCDGEDSNEVLETKLKAPLSSSPMIFDVLTDIPFYREVQTDKAGVLKNICSSLISGGNPAKSNLTGGTLVEVSFVTTNLVEQIIVRTAHMSGSSFIIDEEERFQVDTSPGNRTGQVKFSSKEVTCSNGRVESLTQQLLQ